MQSDRVAKAMERPGPAAAPVIGKVRIDACEMR